MVRDALGYPALYVDRAPRRTVYRVWRTLDAVLVVDHHRAGSRAPGGLNPAGPS